MTQGPEPAPDEAPFVDADVAPGEDGAAPPHGPLIRPVTGRHIAAGAALAVLVEVLARWFFDLPWAGLVLGLAMAASIGIKRAIAVVVARSTMPLPGILWNEALRLAADLAMFYVLLRLFAALLL